MTVNLNAFDRATGDEGLKIVRSFLARSDSVRFHRFGKADRSLAHQCPTGECAPRKFPAVAIDDAGPPARSSASKSGAETRISAATVAAAVLVTQRLIFFGVVLLETLFLLITVFLVTSRAKGYECPSAIAVPSVLYLLLHAGPSRASAS